MALGQLWETIDVKKPAPKFVSKNPVIVMCPVCSIKFDSRTYSGCHEIFAQMEKDFDRHFAEKHSHEDFSQADARIVREARKD